MKTLLEQLPFLTLKGELQGGVMQSLVTIHAVPEWDKEMDIIAFPNELDERLRCV